jgi:hypothetical protein
MVPELKEEPVFVFAQNSDAAAPGGNRAAKNRNKVHHVLRHANAAGSEAPFGSAIIHDDAARSCRHALGIWSCDCLVLDCEEEGGNLYRFMPCLKGAPPGRNPWFSVSWLAIGRLPNWPIATSG